MKKIKTALISVSDKNNLKPILEILKKYHIKIISSGGTYKENQNIFISGMNNEKEQIIKWEINKL